MREIKFRAWDKRNNAMKRDNMGLMMFVGTGTLAWQFADTITFEDRENWELMQYTGLKDKNGKEIYEGDVIQAKRDANGVWVFDKRVIEYKNYTFWFTGIGQPARNFPINFMAYGNKDSYEVIGNIYENPELLTKH